MKRLFYLSALLVALVVPDFVVSSQTRFLVKDGGVVFTDGTDTLRTPSEGLWSVAAGWKDDWMSDWTHVKATKIEKTGDWTVLKGSAGFKEGELELTDSYSLTPEGLVRCVRRFEWTGKDTLRNVTLSVRLQEKGNGLSLFAPGIVYYGNKNGASVNPELIATWSGHPGELAVFEDHRYPMPFVMLENPSSLRAVAVHTTPSPVRGAVLSDQWWSLGAEAHEGVTEIVMYSGPIGYNGRKSTAKARQRTFMRYSDTYIVLEPGRVVEKEY